MKTNVQSLPSPRWRGEGQGEGLWVIAAVLMTLLSVLSIRAADAPKESDFYEMITLPTPTNVVLEVGAIELLPNKKLAVATRRGEIYTIENAFENPPSKVKYTRFAAGLHEVLGLAQRDGWLYVVQRPEVSRLKDLDGDGRADLFETVNDDWGISGDYHEYAFGSKFDREGNIWMVLCLTGSFTSEAEFRGWCMRITPDGKMIPTASGIRSPGGIGMNAAGDMFYTDNQGTWNGSSSLKHLAPGSFQGNPNGNKWYKLAPNMGAQPPDPESGSRSHIEAKKIPQYMPPVCILPHGKVGNSSSGIVWDSSNGKFGPFAGQMFVSDQSASNVARVFLEKVNGRYQGACFMFRQGFDSGNVGMLFTPDGSMFVGGTARGWGARGGKDFALQRVVWTGKVPFEVHEMRAKPDGFELTFTKPVDPVTAGNVESYKMETYTYILQSGYGSPEVDKTMPAIKSAKVSADGKSVRLVVDKLEEGHVHELHMSALRSAEQLPLLHDVAYYTMNAIPAR